METAACEQAYALAKERYAELGVDTEAALRALGNIPISMHCWQGDDVGGFETRRRALRRRHPGHRQLPRQGPHGRRTARRRRRGLSPDPRQAPLQPARHLRRDRRPARSTATRSSRVHFQALDRLGPRDWASAWTSTPPTSPIPRRPTASRWPIATAHPPLLGRARHRLPRDRRGHRPRAGHALRHQRLDSRRLQGRDRRPQGAPRAAQAIARRNVRRADRRPATTSTPSSPSSSASARRATWSARTSSTWATPWPTRSCSASTPGISIPPKPSPTRSPPCCLYLDEILLHVSRGVRWDSDHVVILNDELRAIAEEMVRGGFLGPRPHRPGLLRRQHQSRRRLGDRHAGDAQGPAGGPAGADRRSSASWSRAAISPPGWRCSKRSRPCRSAPCGTTTA